MTLRTPRGIEYLPHLLMLLKSAIGLIQSVRLLLCLNPPRKQADLFACIGVLLLNPFLRCAQLLNNGILDKGTRRRGSP